MDFLDRIRTRAEQRRLGSYLGGRIGKGLCELQHDQVIANADGGTVRADINNALGALFSLSSGTTAPTTTVAYQLWADTTTGLLKQRNAANSGWLVRGSLMETFLIARSSNTILAGGDFGRTILATSSFTQTLTAAATLGDGWFIHYRNDGTGAITLDPNGAETIDGQATILLSPGESCIIFCNGTAFKTLGRNDINTLDADASPDFAADYVVTYDASATRLKKVLLSNFVVFASQAQQEAASSTTAAVTPGRQQFHPSAAKAWVSCDNNGTTTASYNISSTSDLAVGRAQPNLTVSMSSANYCAVGATNGGGGGIFGGAVALATASFEIRSYNTATQAAQDSGGNFAAVFGDQ